MINACAAAADELVTTRQLIEALESENALVKQALETEKKLVAVLAKSNDSREREAEALRGAIKAKDETIAAKNDVIAAREQAIAALRNKPRSPLKRITDILIGAAVFAILK